MKPRLLLLAAVFTVGCHQAVETPEPLATGIEIGLVDKTVRPQDDFFRYVNGGWLAKVEIPADKSSYGSFAELADRAETDLRTIIEESANNPNRAAGSAVQKVGDFYLAFMNETRAESQGAAPIAAELARIDALKTPADLAREIGDVSARGITGPVGGFIDADKQSRDADRVPGASRNRPAQSRFLQRRREIRRHSREVLAALEKCSRSRPAAAGGGCGRRGRARNSAGPGFSGPTWRAATR